MGSPFNQKTQGCVKKVEKTSEILVFHRIYYTIERLKNQYLFHTTVKFFSRPSFFGENRKLF